MSNATRQTILNEVVKDVSPIQFEGSETADFYHQACLDCKEATYNFLQWVDEVYKPKSILYPASGFDVIPKLVFGEERVIHTSLEEYGPGGVRYFSRLGSGKKVIADNANLPFRNESFDVVLLLDSPFPVIGLQRDELLRVLAPDGVVVLSRNIFEDDSAIDRIAHYQNRKDLMNVIIPSELRTSPLGHTEFYGLQKRVEAQKNSTGYLLRANEQAISSEVIV